MPIASPKNDINHPDRQLDCEFALEPAIQQVAEEAAAAGWSEAEVAAALLNLGSARIQQRVEYLIATATLAMVRRHRQQ